ncbi:MAG: hypothetical protein JWO62_2495 [Acidimicrobiaceae bacterium]|jgi:hypothetical protein|nr:hypothetical protein [Acidimicrobiaceae bacterium]
MKNSRNKSAAARRRATAARTKKGPSQSTAGPRRLVGPDGRNSVPFGRDAKARAKQRKRYVVGGAGAAVAALAAALAAALLAVLGGTTSAQPRSDTATSMVSGPPGPEGVPIEVGQPLASTSTAATGSTVDGIQCNSTEQVVYHVHTHLSVYVNGVLRPLPAGVGIVYPVAQQTAEGPFYGATQCYYWLHVHAQDGVIHIESPTQRGYTLGDFFDIWNQPLTATQVGPARGKLTVFVDGRPYRGNPRDVQLGSHEDVQIDVGAPVVTARKVNWSQTQL